MLICQNLSQDVAVANVPRHYILNVKLFDTFFPSIDNLLEVVNGHALLNFVLPASIARY